EQSISAVASLLRLVRRFAPLLEERAVAHHPVAFECQVWVLMTIQLRSYRGRSSQARWPRNGPTLRLGGAAERSRPNHTGWPKRACSDREPTRIAGSA